MFFKMKKQLEKEAGEPTSLGGGRGEKRRGKEGEEESSDFCGVCFPM